MVKEKLKNLISTEGSLQQKTIKSGFWSFASRISTRGLSILKIIIVARLLAPKDFGLLGIALLTLAIFKVFSKTGFKQSIIQKKEKVKDHLNTAWTVLALRGFALYGIVFVSAPYVATFFGEPRAELIIRVIGLTLVFKGLKNIGVIFFQKELEFQKKFALDLSSVVPAFILTVVLAFAWRNVWALVFGNILGAASLLIASFLIHGHRPKPEFKKEKATEMFGFGKWILGSSIVIFIATQGDDIFLGKVLGATALGLYQISYKISNTPATEVTHIISNVTFPAYSKIQDNIKKLKEGFFKTITLTVGLSLTLGVGIILFIPEFTYFILGDKWRSIIWPARILALVGIIRSITAVWGPLYRARGIPRFAFWKNVLRVSGTFIPIYWLTAYYGVAGTSLAVLIGIILCLIFDLVYMRYKFPAKYKLGRLVHSFKGLFLSLSISSIFYLAISKFIDNLVLFLFFSALTIIIFILLMFITEKYSMNPIMKEYKKVLKSLNSGVD